MQGIPEPDYAAIRYENFVAEVLRPRAFRRRAPLEIRVHSTAARPSLEEVRGAAFERRELGDRWGPRWSTAWFQLVGRVPEDFVGGTTALRFSCGTEALWWRDGEPEQAFDRYRDLAILHECTERAGELRLWIEAACNHPHGATTFWWDEVEWRARWNEAQPGRLESAELVLLDRDLLRVTEKFDLCRKLGRRAELGEARTRTLLRGLRELVATIDPRAASLDLARIEAELDRLLRGGGRRDGPRVTLTGHCHIDTAWLWPIAETRRKVVRSFANALALLREFPSFRFTASQAVQYEFLRETSEATFAKVRERVEEGRIEPVGGMWVEPDAHGPSGESLIRQVLVGTAHFTALFGERGRSGVLFLPDTFGFPATLPQIAAKAGFHTFVTNKMSWNERNAFPFVTFRWRGLDGTELLSHFTPGHNYNAPLEPEDLLGAERRWWQKDQPLVGRRSDSPARILQLFGHGDGGGGPTREMLHRAATYANCEGLPRSEPGSVEDFARELHEERAALRARGLDLPVHDGELYLELHRGTYTSQAWLKAENARLERRLRRVEIWFASRVLRGIPFAPEDRARLAKVWETVLLHQFHDILPGTSIAEVYADARIALAEAGRELDRLEETALRAPTPDHAVPAARVQNLGSAPRSGHVDTGEGLRFASDLPALGSRPLEASAKSPAAVRTTTHELENEHLLVRLDAHGRIAELRRKDLTSCVHARDEHGSRVPLQRWWLYDDRPRRWEAWDIDFDGTDLAEELLHPVHLEVVESSDARGAILVEYRFGASRLRQRYVLEAGARRLEVHGEVDWQEERRLLRLEQATRIRARSALHGIAFGHLERPTTRNDAVDEARFEVPGRAFTDLSQPGLGLAVLDDGSRYGRSVHGSTITTSILRAPNFPDPRCDRGEHSLRLGLLLHDGDRARARIVEEAEELAEELFVLPAGSAAVEAPFEVVVESGRSVEIAALKPAEDGRGAILRLVERTGGDTRLHLDLEEGVWLEGAVDLLERPTDGPAMDTDGSTLHLVLRPFEIVSLRLLPGGTPNR